MNEAVKAGEFKAGELDNAADSPYILQGLLGTILVVALSLFICSLFAVDFFLSWVGLFWMACVPAQTVMALMWESSHPKQIANLRQPWKGLGFLALTIGAMIVFGSILLFVFGRGIMPPGPPIVMLSIFAISVILWWVVAWKGWPLTIVLQSPTQLGLAMILTIFPLAYILFQALFSFDFMEANLGSAAILNPGGLFEAWDALIFGITSVALLLIMVLFDFWFFAKMPSFEKPLMSGIVLSLTLFPLTALIMYFAITLLQIDRVVFMVWVPVATIFGFFIVNGLMQNRMFAKMLQPWRGILLSVASIAIGVFMAEIYTLLAPIASGTSLADGAPTYELQLWAANAMLAVTFPIIVVFTRFFDFWPLNLGGKERAMSFEE